MNLRRLFHTNSPWRDGHGDSLIVRLHALGHEPMQISQGVERRRAIVQQEFIRRRPEYRRTRAGGLPVARLAPVLAATVLLMSLAVGGVAASGPGELLYGVRLSVEELLLPGDEEAHLNGQLDRLDRRIDEAAEALAAGNADAAVAALEAYRTIASDVATGLPPHSPLQLLATERVNQQVRRIRQLQGEDVRLGGQRALGAANGVLMWLGGHGPGDGPDPTQPGPSPTPSSRLGPTPAPTPRPTSAGHSAGPFAGSSSVPTASGGPGPTGAPRSSGSPHESAGPHGSHRPGSVE
jgi:hypothetical protein